MTDKKPLDYSIVILNGTPQLKSIEEIKKETNLKTLFSYDLGQLNLSTTDLAKLKIYNLDYDNLAPLVVEINKELKGGKIFKLFKRSFWFNIFTFIFILIVFIFQIITFTKMGAISNNELKMDRILEIIDLQEKNKEKTNLFLENIKDEAINGAN